MSTRDICIPLNETKGKKERIIKMLLHDLKKEMRVTPARIFSFQKVRTSESGGKVEMFSANLNVLVGTFKSKMNQVRLILIKFYLTQ